MLATTGTMQTTYSRNSQNKRTNIAAGSKPHNHDRLMQLESSITPRKSGWQIEVHTNQTYDTWLTTTFPLTHKMTSANNSHCCSISVFFCFPFWSTFRALSRHSLWSVSILFFYADPSPNRIPPEVAAKQVHIIWTKIVTLKRPR